MPDPTAEARIERFTASTWDGDSPFCLIDTSNYKTDSADTQTKITRLFEGAVINETTTSVERACTIGGCTLRIIEDIDTGRQISGNCKAADYCLKSTFQAVGDASTTDEGRRLYRDILSTLEGHANKYSAGNCCPKLHCGLSAGVSIDQVPGTAGDCYLDRQPDQGVLDF